MRCAAEQAAWGERMWSAYCDCASAAMRALSFWRARSLGRGGAGAGGAGVGVGSAGVWSSAGLGPALSVSASVCEGAAVSLVAQDIQPTVRPVALSTAFTKVVSGSWNRGAVVRWSQSE
jgi:hypothetical protein